jgi:hypothetical protein
MGSSQPMTSPLHAASQGRFMALPISLRIAWDKTSQMSTGGRYRDFARGDTCVHVGP